MDTFIVFSPEDRWHGSICHGADEAKEIISGIKDTSCTRVHRITLGELARDVTDEFLSDQEPVEEYPSNYSRTAYMRRIGSYGW